MNSNAEDKIQLPPSGKELSKEEIDELFKWNSEQRDKMAVGAGSLVGALLDELERNGKNYIRLRNPAPGGHTVEYTLVQGKQNMIAPIALFIGFKKVTDSKLEIHNA